MIRGFAGLGEGRPGSTGRRNRCSGSPIFVDLHSFGGRVGGSVPGREGRAGGGGRSTWELRDQEPGGERKGMNPTIQGGQPARSSFKIEV
jgi:hypothetical protein